MSRAVGKSKNLKGEGGESSNARPFRRDKGFAYISAKIEGGGRLPSSTPFSDGPVTVGLARAQTLCVATLKENRTW